mmetsp:Transcript_12891/g.24613  ORF Transcript_12891/g.24613 Transcript_12891/m.24613 type:complete len:82 (-) Transcript_12891:208-453(-)
MYLLLVVWEFLRSSTLWYVRLVFLAGLGVVMAIASYFVSLFFRSIPYVIWELVLLHLAGAVVLIVSIAPLMMQFCMLAKQG